jgi:hypothetical protein
MNKWAEEIKKVEIEKKELYRNVLRLLHIYRSCNNPVLFHINQVSYDLHTLTRTNKI